MTWQDRPQPGGWAIHLGIDALGLARPWAPDLHWGGRRRIPGIGWKAGQLGEQGSWDSSHQDRVTDHVLHSYGLFAIISAKSSPASFCSLSHSTAPWVPAQLRRPHSVGEATAVSPSASTLSSLGVLNLLNVCVCVCV